MNTRREIRSLADFLDIPEEELHRCLRSFREAIQKAKADRAASVQQGLPAQTVKFNRFIWQPQDSKTPLLSSLQATTNYALQADGKGYGI